MEVTSQTAVVAIQEAERTLRQLLTLALATRHGPEWQAAISGRVRQELLRLEGQERITRPASKVDEGILAYAGLAELKAIFQHHWTCCCGDLGQWTDQTAMIRDLERLMTVRGPGAHGRELQAFELLEAEGIARRLIASGHRVGSPTLEQGRIWSFIEWAEDSLGNRSSQGPIACLNGANPIRVGDRVELRVHGKDTKGRPLQYRLLDNDTPLRLPWQGSPIFWWSAQRPCISTELSIEVRTISGPWGHQEYDDFAEFRYKVHP